ncbi:MAG: glycosyltransferase family 4 protein [Thermoguttaceae bacterium]
MRILFVTTCYPRYAGDPCGIFVSRLATVLAEAGNQVHVVAPHAAGFPLHESLGGVAVTRAQYWLPRRHQRLAYGYGILPNIRRNPLLACQAPFLLSALAGCVRRLLPDYHVVHAHFLPAALAAWPACRSRRKPLVLTVYGSDVRYLPRTLTRAFLARVHETIVPAVALRDDLEEVLGRRPLLIPNPIDGHRFRPHRDAASLKNEMGIPFDAAVVTFVARLYPFKDPMTLMRAIPVVLCERPHTRFLFAGDGPLRRELETEARKSGVERSVHILGTRPDVADILSISDVFVAISPVENVWSTTIAEAMTLRVPCVISDAGYSARVFHHGVDAYLVKAASPKSVAAGILALLDNVDLRCRLREGAFRLLRMWGFDTREILDRTVSVYRRVVTETCARFG